MTTPTLDHITELPRVLTADERAELIVRLKRQQHSVVPRTFSGNVTREELIAEHQRLKDAGAFAGNQSLMGKFANPSVELNTEALFAYIREIRDAWQETFNELGSDND